MIEAECRAVRELCDPSRSITYGIVQPGKDSRDGVPVLRVNNFGAGTLDLRDAIRVVPEVESRFARSRPRPGDVLITLVGSIGQVAVAPPEIQGWNLARAVGLLPSKDPHHARWLAYALRAPAAQEFIRQHANTTVQATFNLGDLARLTVPYPSEPERIAILEIVGSLDEKIELNRRMNETLEATAQAIFRDWFVDFGPVRRKLAGETDPVAIMGGIAPDPARATELAALFPAGMGSADVPENWSVEPFGRFFKLERGLSYKGSGLSAHGKPLINLGCFSGAGGFNAGKLKFYVGDHKPRHTAAPGTLLIANTDITQDRVILGSPHIVEVGCPVEESLFSHHVYAARPLSKKSWERFFFYHLMEPAFRDRAAGFATGTTVLALPRDAVEAAEFAVPSEAVLDAFLGIVRPLIDRSGSASAESRTLAETRDYLLPRLMSGQVRVIPSNTESAAA